MACTLPALFHPQQRLRLSAAFGRDFRIPPHLDCITRRFQHHSQAPFHDIFKVLRYLLDPKGFLPLLAQIPAFTQPDTLQRTIQALQMT